MCILRQTRVLPTGDGRAGFEWFKRFAGASIAFHATRWVGLKTITVLSVICAALNSAFAYAMASVSAIVWKIFLGRFYIFIFSVWNYLQAGHVRALYSKFLRIWNYLQVKFVNPVWDSFELTLHEYQLVGCEEIALEELQTTSGGFEEESSPQGQTRLEIFSSTVDSDEQLSSVESSDFLLSSSDDDMDQVSPSDSEFSPGANAYSSESDNPCKLNSGPEMIFQIIAQAEWYFSDEHLAVDSFFLKHCRRRADGYVSLKLVAGLRKVRQVSRDFPTVLAALRLSEKLEVDVDGSKIRRRDPLPLELKNMTIVSKTKERRHNLNRSSSAGSLSGERIPSHPPLGQALSISEGRYQQNSGEPVCVSTEHVKGGVPELRGKLQNRKQAGIVRHEPKNRRRDNRTRFVSTDAVVTLRHRSASPPITPTSPPPHYVHHHRETAAVGSSPPTIKSSRSQRPRSMAMGENIMIEGMSPWLMRRKAAAEGHVAISTAVRQPRGPDGSRGFMIRLSGSCELKRSDFS